MATDSAGWTVGSDGKLFYTGSGPVPKLSNDQQRDVRSQIANPNLAASIRAGAAAPPTPTTGAELTKISGPANAPYSVPGTPANQGNINYFKKGGQLPSGVQMGANGLPTASDTSFAGKDDTVVQWPDGHKTVLMKNGLSVDVPVAQAPASSGGGGGGGGGASQPAAPSNRGKPTKVEGPQKVSDLLPAFSPPAMNQAKLFYDSSQYVPASQLQSPLTNLGGQQSIADILGVPWDGGYTLNLPPGGGQQLPPGGDLSKNYVDPAMYGYLGPILNPAYYQSARTGKTTK